HEGGERGGGSGVAAEHDRSSDLLVSANRRDLRASGRRGATSPRRTPDRRPRRRWESRTSEQAIGLVVTGGGTTHRCGSAPGSHRSSPAAEVSCTCVPVCPERSGAPIPALEKTRSATRVGGGSGLCRPGASWRRSAAGSEGGLVQCHQF